MFPSIYERPPRRSESNVRSWEELEKIKMRDSILKEQRNKRKRKTRHKERIERRRLRKLQKEKKRIKAKKEEDASQKKDDRCICSICLDYINNKDEKTGETKLNCGHKFHLKCFMLLQIQGGANRRNCPNCRAKQNLPIIPKQFIQKQIVCRTLDESLSFLYTKINHTIRVNQQAQRDMNLLKQKNLLPTSINDKKQLYNRLLMIYFYILM